MNIFLFVPYTERGVCLLDISILEMFETLCSVVRENHERGFSLSSWSV